MISSADIEQYFNPEQGLPAGRAIRAQGQSRIIAGTAEAHYRAVRAINASLLKQPTAAEMWHSLNEPPADHWASESAAQKWTVGILLHWAVLEPWKFSESEKWVVPSPTDGLATKKAQAVRAANPDKLVVTAEHIEQARACLSAVQLHPLAQQLLRCPGGERELSAFRWDSYRGIWLKGRFDFAPVDGNYLLDVKTTAFPLPQFPKEARKLGYHLQAANYLDLWEAITGERRDIFYLVAVSKSAPYMARVYDFQNWPRRHPLYEQSPLRSAREILDARLATFLTAAHETRHAMKSGAALSPALTRSLWPAYEGDQPGSTTMLF